MAVVLNFLFFGKAFLYLISVALIAGIFDWAMVRRASRAMKAAMPTPTSYVHWTNVAHR